MAFEKEKQKAWRESKEKARQLEEVSQTLLPPPRCAALVSSPGSCYRLSPPPFPAPQVRPNKGVQESHPGLRLAPAKGSH